jgi:hypothetical protein
VKVTLKYETLGFLPNLRVKFFFLQHSPNSGVTPPLSFSSRYALFFFKVLAEFSSIPCVSKP